MQSEKAILALAYFYSVVQNIRQASNESNSPEISKTGIFKLLQMSLLEMNDIIKKL